MKKVRVILSKEAQIVYELLGAKAVSSKVEKSIFSAFRQKIEWLKKDIHYGVPLAKRLIPEIYVQKYGVANLFRVELPNFWRCCYTIKPGEEKDQVIIFVLEMFDHKAYNKRFGYK